MNVPTLPSVARGLALLGQTPDANQAGTVAYRTPEGEPQHIPPGESDAV